MAAGLDARDGPSVPGSRSRTVRVTVRGGLDLPLAGAPEPIVDTAPPVETVALVADDLPGLRPVVDVEPGERVRTGQRLLHDRRQPEVGFPSPGTGTVAAIHRGPRRRLQSIVVALDGEDEPKDVVPSRDVEAIASLSREDVVAALVASGLWTTLRRRPFGRVPPLDEEPAALLVTAIDTDPLAPDPDLVIAERPADLAAGLTALTRLLDRPVHVCTRPAGPALPDLPAAAAGHLVRAAFDGRHPAGLPGTHVHHLAPVDARRPAWHVGYQDVLAMGELFTTGAARPERIVSLAGPSVGRPRLLRTRRGASLGELLRDEPLARPSRIVAGSVLSGRRASGPLAWLGPDHRQVTVLPEPVSAAAGIPRLRAWTFHRPGRDSRPREDAFTTARHGRPGTFVPLPAFDRVLPRRGPVVPLLRALLLGDAETAEALGCLELLEEDLAPCTVVCPAKIEYGRLLRDVLEALEKRS